MSNSTMTGLDYDVLNAMPEEQLETIGEAIVTAGDGAAALVLLVDAMNAIGIDAERQDAILTAMESRAAQYLTGR